MRLLERSNLVSINIYFRLRKWKVIVLFTRNAIGQPEKLPNLFVSIVWYVVLLITNLKMQYDPS